jgi:hypothetical protein
VQNGTGVVLSDSRHSPRLPQSAPQEIQHWIITLPKVECDDVLRG